MKIILLPVKNPVRAKQRLSNFLSPAEREELQWAMLEDVSRALAGVKEADEIVTVTSSRAVAEHFDGKGWTVIQEKSQLSESHSVDFSSEVLLSRGATAVLRLPADIPLVQSEDIDQLLREGLVSPRAVLVPSRDGSGTNALLRNPPLVFPSRFGPNSFELHQKAAMRRGVELKVCENARIALDLDAVEDLVDFSRMQSCTRTADVLNGFRLDLN